MIETADRAEELLRQRSALGEFGELSLKSDDLDEILTEACSLVSDALGTDLAKVLTCLDRETELLVRAGVGWIAWRRRRGNGADREFLGRGPRPAHGEPVISNDVEQESRFELPDFMRAAWRQGDGQRDHPGPRRQAAVRGAGSRQPRSAELHRRRHHLPQELREPAVLGGGAVQGHDASFALGPRRRSGCCTSCSTG